MLNEYFNKKRVSYHRGHDNKESNIGSNRIVYWGEVKSVNDQHNGGSIKVRIPELDNLIEDNNLSDSYPLLPKFFHIYPKVGEVVRIFIEDPDYPQRGRLWMGSIISQLQNIEFDGIFTALSTTHLGVTEPQQSIDTYPDAEGVFPNKEDIALIGRKNNDIILKENSTEIRVGKHLNGDLYKRNKINPSFIKLDFTNVNDNNETISENIIMADRIAILSHSGNPKFRGYDIDNEYKDKIFSEGHPMVRGDVLLKILEVFKESIIQHIHPYHGVNADPSGTIINLEKLNLEKILQKNLVIN